MTASLQKIPLQIIIKDPPPHQRNCPPTSCAPTSLGPSSPPSNIYTTFSWPRTLTRLHLRCTGMAPKICRRQERRNGPRVPILERRERDLSHSTILHQNRRAPGTPDRSGSPGGCACDRCPDAHDGKDRVKSRRSTINAIKSIHSLTMPECRTVQSGARVQVLPDLMGRHIPEPWTRPPLF